LQATTRRHGANDLILPAFGGKRVIVNVRLHGLLLPQPSTLISQLPSAVCVSLRLSTSNQGKLPPLVGAAIRPDRAIFKMWGSDIWLCDPPSRAAEQWMERV
jgi:hypothetical protein